MSNTEKENLVNHKLQKAKDTIAEAELLMENKMWNAAVSRLYYACFYAANAFSSTTI